MTPPARKRSVWVRLLDKVLPLPSSPPTEAEYARGRAEVRARAAAEAARERAKYDRQAVSEQRMTLVERIRQLSVAPREYFPPPPEANPHITYETREHYDRELAGNRALRECYEAMLARLDRTHRPFGVSSPRLPQDVPTPTYNLGPLDSHGHPWTYNPWADGPPPQPPKPPETSPKPATVTGNFGEDTARRAVSSPEVPSPPQPPPAKEARPAPSPVPLTLPPYSGLKLVPAPRTGRPRTVHDRLLATFVSTHVRTPDRWLPSSSSAPVDGLWIHSDGSRTWVEVKTSRRAVGRDRLRGLSVPERFFGELREAMGDSYLVVRYQVAASGELLGVRITRPFAPPPSGLPPFASRLSSVSPHRRGEPAQAVSPKAS